MNYNELSGLDQETLGKGIKDANLRILPILLITPFAFAIMHYVFGWGSEEAFIAGLACSTLLLSRAFAKQFTIFSAQKSALDSAYTDIQSTQGRLLVLSVYLLLACGTTVLYMLENTHIVFSIAFIMFAFFNMCTKGVFQNRDIEVFKRWFIQENHEGYALLLDLPHHVGLIDLKKQIKFRYSLASAVLTVMSLFVLAAWLGI